jgi:hypothetical protein
MTHLVLDAFQADMTRAGLPGDWAFPSSELRSLVRVAPAGEAPQIGEK